MSNDDEWGNISLPGLDDETLYTKNWGLTHDKRERELMSAITKEKHQDPEYREKWLVSRQTMDKTNIIESNKNRDYEANRELRSKVVKEVHKRPETKAKMEAKRKSQQKTVVDPTGKEWDSAGEAGEHWFPDARDIVGASRKVRNLCNANKDGWKFK